MKHLWISLASLMALPLCAETSGRISYELPPSHHEWKLLIDDQVFANSFGLDGEDDKPGTFQIFTHREGDALEVLFHIDLEQDEEGVSMDEILFSNSLSDSDAPNALLEEKLNRLGFLFPNHRTVPLDLEKKEDGYLFSWIWEDGNLDLAHGVTRVIKTNQGISILQYFTTAAWNEQNLEKWIRVLDQASVTP